MPKLSSPLDAIGFVLENYTTFPRAKAKRLFNTLMDSFSNDLIEAEYEESLSEETIEAVTDFAQFVADFEEEDDSIPSEPAIVDEGEVIIAELDDERPAILEEDLEFDENEK